MNRNLSLGVNVTSDMVNDFFRVSSKSALEDLVPKVVLYQPGRSAQSSQQPSGAITPMSPYSHREEPSTEQELERLSLSECGDDGTIEPAPQPEDELLLPEPEVEDDNADAMYKQAGVDHAYLNVYENYSFSHEYDPQLPITQFRDIVLQTIETNRVTIVEGSTGSGKTTQVPQYILDHYHACRRYCNILVTQPRRIAALTVASRVADERGWQLGNLVGYQVARDRKVSEDTRITYMTTGVFLQKLIKNKSLGEYTHIVLDEVHERDQDIDFAMLVTRKFLRTVSKHVKVVLMSATADCTLFSNYFSILINGKPEGAPVVAVGGTVHDVKVLYLEDIGFIAQPLGQDIMLPIVPVEIYQLCREIIRRLDDGNFLEREVEEHKLGEFSKTRGTVLVFLPGLPEITEMHRHLVDVEEAWKLTIVPLHSKITSAEQIKAFRKPEPYCRKVILSTNIAESSITIPDIRYVIDFCLAKNMETDRSTNYECLKLQWASRSSLVQRKGRAGRVSSGYCFRLIGEYFYHQLDEHIIPEMQRCPLEQVVLKVKLLELGPPAVILRLALQPPQYADIRRTILLLKEVGALTVRQDGKINPLDGDLTFLGRVLGTLPVDVHIGKLLAMGFTFGVLEECVIIGACLSLKSIFSKPFKEDLKAYIFKMKMSNWSESDLLASLAAYKAWKLRKDLTGFGLGGEKQWSRENLLEVRQLKEVDELAKELSDRLAQFNMHCSRDIFKSVELKPDDELVLKVVIAGAFYPNYFTSNIINEQDAARMISGHDPFNTIMVHGCPSTLCYYPQSVAKLFRRCGQGKRLYFESSRLYVEFERPVERIPVKVNPAVTIAIKMRQLRIPLNIYVSKEKDAELQKKLSTGVILENGCGLRSSSICTRSDGSVNLTMQREPRQVELKKSGYISVHITHVVEAGHFWAHYAEKENFDQLLSLHEKINRLGGRTLQPIRPDEKKVGSFCLAPFEEEYYRAVILNSNRDWFKVFFVDFGNSIELQGYQLKSITSELLALPFQSFECYLAHVRPLHGQWRNEATDCFKELIKGRIRMMAKVFSVIHDQYRLELMIETDKEEVKSVGQILIDEKFAHQAEESVLSKMNHEEAKTLGTAQHARSKNDTVELSQMSEWSEVKHGEETTKIQLRGPWSPYEQSFFGLTVTGRSRATGVEPDSVNSVVICEEPQDKHPRLLISADVGISSGGNKMIARETTLLPNIHGLCSFIPLLFAPVAELRRDKKETKYTGALCGLGFDDSGDAIFPDHDIEVAFRVKFGVEDLVKVNYVRACINAAIGIEGSEVKFAHQTIEKIQNQARSRLLSFLVQPFEEVEPVTFQREYRWNQIPEEYLLECMTEAERYYLYSYHKGILFPQKETPVDPRIAAEREKLKRLEALAGDSTEPFKEEVVCCSVRCRHPRALRLHMNTKLHRDWVP